MHEWTVVRFQGKKSMQMLRGAHQKSGEMHLIPLAHSQSHVLSLSVSPLACTLACVYMSWQYALLPLVFRLCYGMWKALFKR